VQLMFSQSFCHELDHSQEHERLAGLTACFIILGKTARATQPGKSSFNNPASGQDDKASAWRLGHNLQMDSASTPTLAQVPNPLFKLVATITAIRPDFLQSPMLVVSERYKQWLGSISILQVGRLNLHFQHQTKRIYEHMTLSAVYFLA
jgi:hypothetical protein